MNTIDKINLIICICSLFLATVSVVTVILTIKQNNKMIESSSRPYLSIYDNFTYFDGISYYIVFKNFGQSRAYVKKFDYDVDLLDCVNTQNPLPPFSHMVGTCISPNQSFITEIDITELLRKTDRINFSIEYLSPSGKLYKEDITLNLKSRTDNLLSKSDSSNKELKIISDAIQDLVRKQL